MTPRERIARLEGLLERITRNASRPRALRVTSGTASAPDSAPELVQVAPVPPSAMGHPSETPPPSSVPTAPPVQAPSQPEAAQGASSAPPWKPEPSSTVQARPSSMPPEELSDDDLVEVTTIPPAPEPAALLDASGAEDIEEPPASSRRSKVVAESLDQAIASAAQEIDGREVPIHTPPPESGPQEAVLPAGIEAPRAPQFGELEPELEGPAPLGPTPEQLGETIELDGAESPTIEIEVGGEPVPEPVPERPVEELEVALPRAEMPSGTYDVSISMPAAAQVVHSALPTVPAQASRGPEITTRPEFEGSEVARTIGAGDKAPESFKELLDASLAL